MPDVEIDLRVAELLASRLCHDLVSPIGAVNNGMELLAEDLDGDVMQDAVQLAEGSARQASATVQFYRLAYGQAGRQVDLGSDELRELTAAYLKPQKASLDWQADGLTRDGPEGSGKLLLNMIALALEALQRGGTITAAARFGARQELAVTAAGRNAGLRQESRAALEGASDPAELTPRAVQAYFTQLVARRLGTEVVLRSGEGEAALTAALDPGG
jgi:histidine phosphotransferase ChpT